MTIERTVMLSSSVFGVLKHTANQRFMSYIYRNFPKCPILLFSLSLFCFACNQQSDNSSFNKNVPDSSTIEGVWELTNHYWVKDGDTLYSEPDLVGVQHKMYLDGYVMWIADPLPDSTEKHGYGTYQLNMDTLIEKFSSMSLPTKAEMGSEQEVIYTIEYDKNFLKQATNRVHRKTIYQSIEEWKRLQSF
jgi:hypothetical protein